MNAPPHDTSVVSGHTCSAADDFDEAELQTFARTFPYLEFRRYRSISSRADQRCLVRTILHEKARSLSTCASRVHGELAGIAVLSPLDWDTTFFDQPMAALRLLVGPADRRRVASELLDTIFEASPEPLHVTLRLDAEDFDVRIAAEDRGFRVMDTLCTYECQRKFSPTPRQMSFKYHVRRYEDGDRGAVLDIAERCFSGYPNRLCLDRTIGPDRARDFYRTWADKCCSGELAAQMLVAEHRDRVIGFLGWRLHPGLLAHAGIRLHGSGLGGCVPTRFNAYMELLWHGVKNIGDEAADFDTHLFNVATINMYQRLGFAYVKARHTLHRTS